MNKEEAITKVNQLSQDKRNQAAIVNLITGVGKTERIVHEIPGGAHLHDHQDAKSLPNTIFNWLRFRPDFDRFEISFVGDFEVVDDLIEKGLKARKKQLENFNHKNGQTPYWQKRGLRHLADLLAKYLVEQESPLSFVVDKEGIQMIYDYDKKFAPDSEIFHPVLIIHRKKN